MKTETTNKRLSVKWVSRMLIASLFMEMALIGSAVFQLAVLPKVILPSEDLRVDEMVSALVGLVYLLVYLTTVVVFARWILHAHRKVRQLGANDIPISPVAAVGYFFVPILGLFKPYQAMKDLWRASVDPANWSIQEVPRLLPTWWTLWIIGNIMGQLSMRLGMRAETASDFKFVAGVDIVSGLIGIALAIVARRLVLRITEQIKRWETAETLVGS